MVLQEILPLYLSIGVSEEKFWDSNPIELRPYVDAENLRIKKRDEEMWRNGIYTMNATMNAIAIAFGNKKAQYMSEPIMAKEEKQKEEEILTEEEVEQGRKNLLNWLQVMQYNFEITNGGKNGE